MYRAELFKKKANPGPKKVKRIKGAPGIGRAGIIDNNGPNVPNVKGPGKKTGCP